MINFLLSSSLRRDLSLFRMFCTYINSRGSSEYIGNKWKDARKKVQVYSPEEWYLPGDEPYLLGPQGRFPEPIVANIFPILGHFEFLHFSRIHKLWKVSFFPFPYPYNIIHSLSNFLASAEEHSQYFHKYTEKCFATFMFLKNFLSQIEMFQMSPNNYTNV